MNISGSRVLQRKMNTRRFEISVKKCHCKTTVATRDEDKQRKFNKVGELE